MIMLNSHARCVEEHEEDHEPVEPLLLHRAADEEPAKASSFRNAAIFGLDAFSLVQF